MKRALFSALLSLGVVTASLQGGELKAKDPRTGKEPRPVSKKKTKPAKLELPGSGETCGNYGTSVVFEDTTNEAAKKALKEEKLVMVLHVSGNFEDPRFT